MSSHLKHMLTNITRSYLPAAKLKEYVNIVLVFKVMREFHHMLV